MPKVWAPREKRDSNKRRRRAGGDDDDDDDDDDGSFSFGRYDGDAAGRNGGGGDISSRLLRIKECRTRDEYFDENRRRGSESDEDGASLGRGRTPTIKSERRSPASLIKTER